jgi:hypothetical protein
MARRMKIKFNPDPSREMKRRFNARDVTHKSNPYIPATHNVDVPGASRAEQNLNAAASTKANITPATMVSGFSKGIRSAPGPQREYSLPSTISPSDVYQERFGNRRMNFSPKK